MSPLISSPTVHQSQSKKKSTAKKSTTKKSTSKKGSASKKSRPVARQTQPDTERSREIQEALKNKGYLNGPPSGKWDAATSAAFARYQQDRGRKPTGKPDALSLKDLGLGYKPEPFTPQ